MIPMSEAHLRSILKAWADHYNRGRPHSVLGPGVPDPPREQGLSRSLNPDIDWRRMRSCSRNRSSEACITNIRLCPPRPDRVFAHDRGGEEEAVFPIHQCLVELEQRCRLDKR